MPPQRIPAAITRIALDRRVLRATEGLSFFKLVGTGSGRTFTVRDADPCRWGLVAAWDSAGALARFERTSPTVRAWQRLADERFRLDLTPLRSRGRWSRRTPFAASGAAPGDAPVAAITRARIRWRHARRFWASVPPVSQDLHQRPGAEFAIGFGEAPVGLQGTLSVWQSSAVLQRFAYEGQAHRDAIAATHAVGWYAEELFARFAVLGWHGTVAGRDPLAALEPPGA